MNDATANFFDEQEAPFNLRLFFLKYLRYWHWFLLSISLTLLAAYWYLRYTTPIYQINAVLLIKDHPKDDLLKEKSAQVNKSVENEIELLKSRNLMLRVVDELNLTVNYFRQSKVLIDEEMYDTSPITVHIGILASMAYQQPIFIKILNKHQYEIQDKKGQQKGMYTFDQPIKSEYGTMRVFFNDSLYRKDNNLIKVAFYSRENIAQNYKSAIKVELLSPKSTVLKLTLEDAVPNKGKAILRKLLEAYTFSELADKNREASNTLQFIEERLRLITAELDHIERNEESYKSTRGITNLSEEGTLYLGAVSANDTKLNEIDIQLQVLNGVEKYLKNSQSGGGTAALSVNDPVLTELLSKLNGLQTQQEKYTRTTQTDNPFLQTVNAQITNTKSVIRENVANQRQNLLLTRTNLQQLTKRFESSIRTIPQKEREYVNIKRQQSIKESLYLQLLQKKEEAAVSFAASVTDSRAIDDPYSPSYPIKPSRPGAYLIAFLAGLLIPVGGISLRGFLNNTVQTRKEIENETGIMVFGEIMKKPKGAKNNIIDTGSVSIIAEQFRMLRADLQYIDRDIKAISRQVILVTSSISGEGKSFVSINLASSIAQLNKRVVILELDLRKPKITNYLGMHGEKINGISNYLTGQHDINNLIRPISGRPNMYLVSSGPVPTNPSELLSNGRIDILLKELRQHFDYIILDTPPITFVADTILLSPFADAIFYVVRHDYTPRTYLQQLASLRTSQKFKSLHVIFNSVDYRNNQEFESKYRYAYKYIEERK